MSLSTNDSISDTSSGTIPRNSSLPESIQREYPQGPIPTSHAITFREDKVLLVKRAHQPSKGRWSVPGGMIELGETIYAAAQRELREECGIEIRIEKVVNAVDNIVLDESGYIRFHYKANDFHGRAIF